MMVVRFADDAIVGFQHRAEAERFLTELRERLAKFGLERPPEKSRLREFGPYAAANRQRAGQGKPETFTLLGFAHICGKKRNGRFTVVRQTIRRRLQAKLREVKAELRRRMHVPIPVVGAWLRRVVGGHPRYYGVPMNGPALGTFRFHVGRLWYRTLRRRGQRRRLTWERMRRLIERRPHPHQLVRANAADLELKVLAFNLLVLYQRHALGCASLQRAKPLRRRLLAIAGRLIRTAGPWRLQLAQDWAGQVELARVRHHLASLGP